MLTVKRLEEQSQFLSVMTGALSGSRSNFMVLVKWSKDNDFVFYKEASDSVDSAVVLNGYNPMGTRFVLEWADGVDASKIPYEGLQQQYWNVAPRYRPEFAEFVWRRVDIPKRDRMHFLLQVIQKEESLKTVMTAIRIFAPEAGLQQNVFDVSIYERWWETNNGTIK